MDIYERDTPDTDHRKFFRNDESTHASYNPSTSNTFLSDLTLLVTDNDNYFTSLARGARGQRIFDNYLTTQEENQTHDRLLLLCSF